MRLLLALTLLLATSPRAAVLLYQVHVSSKEIALTFDAGSDRGYAARILTTLEKNHVHASFGMTGKWALTSKDLVKRMAKDGDLLMNHTYDHQSFTGYSSQAAPLSVKQRTWEVNRTESIVHSLTGKSTKPFFRPPYGDYDNATLQLVGTLGYRYSVMWTVDTLGWNGATPAQILSRCVAGASSGGIVVMHVGIQSKDALALQQVITALKDKGYRLVTVAQLVGRG